MRTASDELMSGADPPHLVPSIGSAPSDRLHTSTGASILKRLFTARAFFRDPVGYAACARGDVFPLAAGPARFAVVRDPAEVRRILVTDVADFPVGRWKR